MKDTFIKLTQTHFQFLIDEYGFTLSAVIPSPREEPWEGEAQYTTDATYVTVNSTRGEIPSLEIARVKDKNQYELPIQTIYEYMALTDDEKEAVLSVSQGRQADDILYRKQLFFLTPKANNEDERMTAYLITYVNCLREYCTAFLRGDFSLWLPIWEYHLEKLTVEFTRMGRPLLIPEVTTDEKGKMKVIGKVHIFQQTIDYIQSLKNERAA